MCPFSIAPPSSRRTLVLDVSKSHGDPNHESPRSVSPQSACGEFSSSASQHPLSPSFFFEQNSSSWPQTVSFLTSPLFFSVSTFPDHSFMFASLSFSFFSPSLFLVLCYFPSFPQPNSKLERRQRKYVLTPLLFCMCVLCGAVQFWGGGACLCVCVCVRVRSCQAETFSALPVSRKDQNRCDTADS